VLPNGTVINVVVMKNYSLDLNKIILTYFLVDMLENKKESNFVKIIKIIS
jgi:hypothetical protein